MSIETSDPQSPAGSKASVAADETKRVGSVAAEAGQGVAHEAAAQASNVVGEAKNQFSSLVDQTKREVRTQLDSRSQQAASGLQSLSRQLTALKEGRMDEAGGVRDMLSDLQQRVQRYSDSIQQRGPNAMVDDVTAFARRRPMTFLVGAALGGFAIGRLVRSGAMSSSHDGSDGSMYGTRRAIDGGLYDDGFSSISATTMVPEPLEDGGRIGGI